MILSIGEILVDMIGNNENGKTVFDAHCGGAPFNVAVNAKKAGASVAFLGRVGADTVGNFLIKEAEKAKLDKLDIQKDDKRNTTLAFVTLDNGERDFSFYRHDTADFNVDIKDVDFYNKELSIVHLGSLMLSEKNGKKLAAKIAKNVKKAGKLLSFDLNFRMDIYKDFNDALNAYKPFVSCADIIKFSDDELRLYTGIEDVKQAVESIYKKGTLIVVSLGSKGSFYYVNGEYGIVPTEKVKPVDTTGAGDAFFGTLLANIEGKSFTKENIENALIKANKAGADTTQFMGAIEL